MKDTKKNVISNQKMSVETISLKKKETAAECQRY